MTDATLEPVTVENARRVVLAALVQVVGSVGRSIRMGGNDEAALIEALTKAWLALQ